MRIGSLVQDDIDVPQNHELLVENEAGTSLFRITIDTSDECDEKSDHKERVPRDDGRRTKKARKSSRFGRARPSFRTSSLEKILLRNRLCLILMIQHFHPSFPLQD